MSHHLINLFALITTIGGVDRLGPVLDSEQGRPLT